MRRRPDPWPPVPNKPLRAAYRREATWRVGVISSAHGGRSERVHGDGDGWVACDLGHRHWGRYGAAGLLLSEPGRIVLQHRAPRTHEGDTWGLPGGARDSHEDPVATALREAAEEAAIVPASVDPIGLSVDDHGGWAYTTIVARTTAPVLPHAANWESEDVRWCELDEVDRLPLHPGFGRSWPGLRDAMRPVEVIVDMANVVGSRPDGWWRDRPGANVRLRERIAALAAVGLAGASLPEGIGARALTTSWPRWVLVVEGIARSLADDATDADATDADATDADATDDDATDDSQTSDRATADHATANGPTADDATGRVQTVSAPGSGDDEIVTRAHANDGDAVLVVTADRGLRGRLGSVATVGPNWLLGLLDAPDGDPVRPG